MSRLNPMVMLMACLLIAHISSAQDSLSLNDKVLSFPTRFLNKISNKTSQLEQKIITKSGKALKQLAREERRLQRKLAKKDSVLAKHLFQDVQTKYQSLHSLLNQKTNQTSGRIEYIPFLDTLKTSIRFFEKGGILSDNKLLQETSQKINGMESRFAQAKQVQQYLRNRRQYLKEQLGKLGMAKELKQYYKKAWYYNAQIEEYKSILTEPQKIERKALDLLSKTKAFQQFMSRHSLLASLFPTPDNSASTINAVGLPGLQTRAQVNTLIQQTACVNGPNNTVRLFQ